MQPETIEFLTYIAGVIVGFGFGYWQAFDSAKQKIHEATLVQTRDRAAMNAIILMLDRKLTDLKQPRDEKGRFVPVKKN